MTRVSGNNIPAAPNNEVIFWVFETFEFCIIILRQEYTNIILR